MKSIVDRSAIFRVLNQANKVEGTAFLVLPNLLVTCAHVIRACQGAPGENIHVSREGQPQIFSAYIRPELWDDTKDVSFLEITEPLPNELTPFTLGPSADSETHSIMTFGYPLRETGIIGVGTVRGSVQFENGMDYIQIDSSEIAAGYSGAPVWDTKQRRVVGMVTAIAMPKDGRMEQVAFATPVDTLIEICPLLDVKNAQIIERLEIQAYLQLVSQEKIELFPPKSEPFTRLVVREEQIDSKNGIVHEELVRSPLKTETGESLEAVIQKFKSFILLGDPGSGKTTSLKMLARSESERVLQKRSAKIPLYIDLKTYNGELFIDLFSEALMSFMRRWDKNDGITKQELENLINEFPDNFLFLLDALDEVKVDYRDQVFGEIEKWLKSRASCVVAWRIHDYIPGLWPNLEVYRLIELSATQVRDYLARRYNEQGHNFYESQLRRNLSLRTLAQNPLFLSLVTAFWDANPGAQLPQNPGLLVQQFLEDLPVLKRSERRSQTVQYYRVKDFLSRLAYQMKARGLSNTTIEELAAWPTLQDISDPEPFLMMSRDIRLLAAAGEDKIKGQVKFAHNLFLEYFAAREIQKRLLATDDYEPIIRPLLTTVKHTAYETQTFRLVATTMHLKAYDYFPLHWRGVVLMLVNIFENKRGLLQALANCAAKTSHIDHSAFLVYEVWQGQPELIDDPACSEAVATALIQELTDSDPFWQWQASVDLEKMGKMSVPLLKKVATAADNEQRFHAIRLLAKLAPEESSELFLKVLNDPIEMIQKEAYQGLLPHLSPEPSTVKVLLEKAHTYNYADALLAEVVDKFGVDCLKAFLNDQDSQVSHNAIARLSRKCSQPGHIKWLVKAFEIHINRGGPGAPVGIYQQALQRCEVQFPDVVIDELAELISHSTSIVKERAIDCLAKVENKKIALVLDKALADQDWVIRQKALRALRKVHDFSYFDKYLVLMIDPYESVRIEAAISAIELGNIPNNISWLGQAKLIRRLANDQAISSRISSITLHSYLSRNLEHPDAEMRLLVVDLLLLLQTDKMPDQALRTCLRSSDATVREKVLRWVLTQGETSVLVQLLLDPELLNLPVTFNLIEKLKANGTKDQLSELVAGLLQNVPQVNPRTRQGITTYLVQIGPNEMLARGVFERGRTGGVAASVLSKLGPPAIPYLRAAILRAKREQQDTTFAEATLKALVHRD